LAVRAKSAQHYLTFLASYNTLFCCDQVISLVCYKYTNQMYSFFTRWWWYCYLLCQV